MQQQQLHKNFYENIAEANLRLQQTVVTYDGEPMYVHVITDHKGDGAFRVFMSPVADVGKGLSIVPLAQYPPESAQLGPALDLCVEGKTPIGNGKLIRKRMDSPLFNKFRPFPMGMVNYKGTALFLERRPNRPSTKQGLQPQSTVVSALDGSVGNGKGAAAQYVLYTQAFTDCVKGDYPSPKECLTELMDEHSANVSAAFHRNFAFVAGPINTMFLAYKAEIVAALPYSNLSEVRLGKDYAYTKEAIADLNLFSRII